VVKTERLRAFHLCPRCGARSVVLNIRPDDVFQASFAADRVSLATGFVLLVLARATPPISSVIETLYAINWV
jgi:hypothetical protein